MRRFIVRFLLGIAAAWVASFLLPGVTTDRTVISFVLMGLFLGVAEVILPLLDPGAAILLFFIPRSLRIFLLRGAAVAIAAWLTAGFGFTNSVIGIVGFTILLSLFYLLPFAG